MLHAGVDMILQEDGYELLHADTVQRALQIKHETCPDLILLDIDLPERSETTLSDLIFRLQKTPVIVISGQYDLEQKIAALEAGAEDYFVRPFIFRELLARIRMLLKRGGTHDNLQRGDLRLHTSQRRVFLADQPVDLTSREFELLEYLLRRPQRVVSREELLNRVWHLPTPATTHVVEVYINSLRTKLNDRDKNLIQTVRGLGYSFGEAKTYRSR